MRRSWASVPMAARACGVPAARPARERLCACARAQTSLCLVCATLVRNFAKKSAGSGIPEIKVILGGAGPTLASASLRHPLC